ncbi:MAG: GTPase HflX [Clostridia bacterium]|nr:GTPase HflX [Clostridia bacterium]
MKEIKTCLLLGVSDGNDAEASMAELEQLAETAGLVVRGVLLQQRQKPDNATYIGAGKVEEMKEFISNHEIDLAIANGELSAGQIRNLEDGLDVAVIDRTMLILDIFAGRAQSAEGRLQVELAQLKYRLPRLAGLGESLSRLGGGIGTRGPGETKLETDRRHIRRRIKALENALKEVKQRRQTVRRGRIRGGKSTAALVGYTNAGKSTLLNRLCGSEVYAEDQLFATLDTTVRRMEGLKGQEILLSDTVGFLRDLPHTLIDAFHSTLEESLSADLLLLVLDGADPEAEARFEVVRDLLHTLQADQKPIFLILNKIDKEEMRDLAPLYALGSKEKMRVFPVSAKTGTGCEELKRAISRHFAGESEKTVLVPYDNGAALAELYRDKVILNREETDAGIKITYAAEEKA